jgi:hypothetical protein
MMSENSKIVLEFVKANDGKNITAADIAEGTGLSARQVNGIVTSAFQKKGYMTREAAEIELSDGSHKAVKFIKLTDTGRVLDPDAEETAE